MFHVCSIFNLLRCAAQHIAVIGSCDSVDHVIILKPKVQFQIRNENHCAEKKVAGLKWQNILMEKRNSLIIQTNKWMCVVCNRIKWIRCIIFDIKRIKSAFFC